jgi:hypothetical protein
MSRFYDDGDWDYGRWMLWEQATQRALSGKRGQAALRDLEGALLALPEKRLIESYLAKDGEVCAVGALVLAKRCQAGETREAVLADMERISDPEDYCAADVTASEGKKHGRMAYAMAWRIAELNDEDCRDATPERRYEYVLAWVRKAQLPAAGVSGAD